MQDIIVEKPYKFVPPIRSTVWPRIIRALGLHEIWLRRAEGVVAHECRHVERLKESLQAGHGVMLTPNHCRYADPLVMGYLSRPTGVFMYAMASWHLFNQGRFFRWAIRRMGGFSVNREGIDRQAINTAVDILEQADRPLIIFPEGAVTRTNDRLHALLDGTAFIARAAAKKRAKRDGGKVVVHPVALKYLYGGDIEKTGDRVLTDLEPRFSWQPQRHLPLMKRIRKFGMALLSLKELEFTDHVRSGPLDERLLALIDHLLCPLEIEWFGAAQSGPVVPRVKALRMKILPEMVSGEVRGAERDRRWEQLAKIYLSQQVSSYPPDYLVHPTVDRVLETLERFEEDLNDKVRVHGHLKVILDVGSAIEVDTQRDRKAEVDPLMVRIQEDLQGMLDQLALESRPLPPADQPDKAAQVASRSDLGE